MVSNAVGSNGDGAEDSGTPDGTQQVRNALERRWRDVDPNEIANAMLRPQLGAAGEWDPPEGVEPKRPLLYLSIGIPDGRALPREAMSQAMEKAFAHKNDAPFRYGYGDVKTREYLAENYSKHRGVKVSADWFQITKRIVTISGRSRSDNTRSDKSAGASSYADQYAASSGSSWSGEGWTASIASSSPCGWTWVCLSHSEPLRSVPAGT